MGTLLRPENFKEDVTRLKRSLSAALLDAIFMVDNIANMPYSQLCELESERLKKSNVGSREDAPY